MLTLVLLVWLARNDSAAQIVEDCSTMAGGAHCAASGLLSTRQGCCPVGDVVAFIEGAVDWEGACGGGVETEALCLKHRTHLARWLSCLAVRVPSALVGALPAHGVTELMRAIATGTRDEIVDSWESVSRSHRDDPFSEAEVRRIIECRPTQSTGVVYALWGLVEPWVDAHGTTRFLFPGEGHQRVRDLRASIASIRASSQGSLIGITVMVETPSESISADSVMRMLVESVEQSGLDELSMYEMWGSLLHDLQDLYQVHIRDIPRDAPWDGPGRVDAFAWKFQAMRRSPYDFSLLLDADTFLCAQSLADIWRLLQRFDLVATHAAFFFYEDGVPPGADIVARVLASGAGTAVPDAFVQLNTAVMAFAKNARIDALLRRALELSALFQVYFALPASAQSRSSLPPPRHAHVCGVKHAYAPNWWAVSGLRVQGSSHPAASIVGRACCAALRAAGNLAGASIMTFS